VNRGILSISQRLALKIYEKGNNWEKEHNLPGGRQAGKVYIIRRSGRKLGLFSYFETVLPRIDYAYKNNMIPVVDMCNFDNSIKEFQEHNPWDDYFEQPGGLSLYDAYRSNKITLSESGIPENRPNENMDFFNNKDNQLEYWRVCCKQYIRLKPEIRERVNLIKKQVFDEDDKILGVLARGTDYIRLRPSGHPIQPSVEEILSVVEKKIAEYNYTKVFLATEDSNIATKFKEELDDKCIVGNCDYIEYKTGYLADSKANTNGRTMDYLINIIILSECDGIVAGRTSGTVGAAVLSEGWKDTYFFDLGLYE